MDLEPYFYTLLPELAETGSYAVIAGTYELKGFEKGPRSFLLDNGIQYELSLTNTGAAVVISGTVEAQVTSECDRCLEPAHLLLEGEAEGYVLFEEPSSETQAGIDEYIVAHSPEAIIDLAAVLYPAIILSVPPIVLCDDDCAGICPSCGANLNEEACTCSDLHIDENHPFAALKDIL